jgi:ankyrin repeat protein
LPRQDGPPALVFAAGRGRTEIVDILLRANARVDDAEANGWTACHVAAAGGHHEVLALLLARRPNLAVVDVDGRTALYFAVRYSTRDNGRCALMLLEAGASLDEADDSDLCRFAATSTAAIQALVDRGVVVRELRDSDGSTPLHAAVDVGTRDSPAVFDLLVNVCGIDLEARDRDGATCLHFAASHGNVFALRWLLNAGADANSLTSNGSTPLHNVRHYHCAVLLLAAGASVCARDDSGRTALHSVPSPVWMGPIEMTVVHPLIAAGCDLDAVDDDGETARELLARLVVGPLTLTKSKPRAETLQRRESTLCVIEHFKFVSGFNRSNSMRCKCAKS